MYDSMLWMIAVVYLGLLWADYPAFTKWQS